MAERPDCARTDLLIPELAIGVAAGDDRAGALGHIARCIRCRSSLEWATAAADAMLLLTPEREPPPGFESRVLAGLPGQAAREAAREARALAPPPAPPAPAAPVRPGRPGRAGGPPVPAPRRPRRPHRPSRPGRPSEPSRPGRAVGRWWRTAVRWAAVTATVAGIVGGTLWWRTGDDRRLAEGYRDTLAIAHGRYMRAAPLVAQGVAPAGHMFAYEGEPSWIIVIVRTGNVSGGYAVRLYTRDGRQIPLGTMTVAHGQGWWGNMISIPVDQIATVTVTSPGAPAISARFG